MSDFDEIFKSLVKFLYELCVKPDGARGRFWRGSRCGVRGAGCEGANCDLETWGLGDLGTWRLGDWGTGGLGDLGTWRLGDLETGRLGDLGTGRLGEV